jgi:hypothetical protein
VSYQLLRVPAYSVNRTKRLTRSPKIFWSDTAMALHLSGLPEPTGHHLENLIVTNLAAWCGSQSVRPTVYHWRTVDQREVDLVLELPTGQVLAIEIKGGARPGWTDVPGLRAFMDEYSDLVLGGLVLHGGKETYRLDARTVATPCDVSRTTGSPGRRLDSDTTRQSSASRSRRTHRSSAVGLTAAALFGE